MRCAIFLLVLAACGNNDANNKHPLLDGMPGLGDSGSGSGATSPFGNVAIVTSTADGDAIYVLDDGGTNHAWRNRGKVTYTGAGPMLPGDVATIDRGALEGHVLVAELSSIRHLAFHDDGSVVDLGSLQFGDGIDQILGAIGVTP